MQLEIIDVNAPQSQKIMVDILLEIFDNNSKNYQKVLEDYFNSNLADKLFCLFKLESSDDEVNKNKPAGFCAIHSWKPIPKPGKEDRTYWQLANFYLKPEFREQGRGSDCLELALKLAESRNVEKIITFAGGGFGKFFQKHGFEGHNSLVKKLSH